MASATVSIRYRFGSFDLQTDERCLRAGGRLVPLRPHAFELLVSLLDRAGHLITKQELLQRVWPGVVVEENSLQAQISVLRKTLGPDAIATVSGQGYRFALPVRVIAQSPTTGAPAQSNLPSPLSTFIGRENEGADIRRLLLSTRLLTLTGAGGCGKTRLALQVASSMQDAYPHGIRLVELAPLSDPSLVVQALAKALSIVASPGRDLAEAVAEWLAPQEFLLVMDNAEHLLDACASLVHRLLCRCPNLTILATSRERLRVEGELSYRVPSLSLPPSDDLRQALDCEAARLFINRVRLHRPDFDPTSRDVAALASICRRLDGIALALELAAAQSRLMSLEALNARLDNRFAVLAGGSRTALPRHRTLRSMIDWSYALLRGPEQVVLRQVSVFAGGWSLEAAEQICRGDDFGSADVLSLLSSLEDKSLVVAETKDGHIRFGMLETLRDYGQERLRDCADGAAVYGRLVDYLIELATGLDAQNDAELRNTLRQLDAEHDNLRVALAWCESDPTRSISGLRLAALLVTFWRVRGHHGEGLAWLDRLWAQVPAREFDETHALARHASGTLLGVDSDQTAAAKQLREAVDLWRRLGDLPRLARSLVCLAGVEWYRGDSESTRKACSEALTISYEHGDLRNVTDALLYTAEMARVEGEFDTAETLLDRSLVVSRDIGGWATAATLAYRAALDYSRGDLFSARSTWQQSLPGYREFGDRQGTCAALMCIAMVSQELSDISAATSSLREAWDCLPGGNDNELLYWLDAFAGLLVARDNAIGATRLLGCIARHRDERDLERPDSKRYLRMLEAARRALPNEDEFDRAWNEGKSWSLDDASRLARDFNEALKN